MHHRQCVRVFRATRLEHFAGKIGNWIAASAANRRGSWTEDARSRRPHAMGELRSTPPRSRATCHRPPATPVGPWRGRESKYPKPPYNFPIPFDIAPLPCVQLSDRPESLFWRCDLEEPIAGGKNVHDPGRKD